METTTLLKISLLWLKAGVLVAIQMLALEVMSIHLLRSSDINLLTNLTSEFLELLLFLAILISMLMDLKDAHFACSEIAVSESTNSTSIQHGMEVSTPQLALLVADQVQ